MIKVTAINGKKMLLNELHIENIQSTPDSIVTFMNGKNYAVKESLDEILNLIYSTEHKKTTKKTIALKKLPKE